MICWFLLVFARVPGLSPYFSFFPFLRGKGLFCIMIFWFLLVLGWGSGACLPSFLSFLFSGMGRPMNSLLHMNVVETWFVAVWGLCWCNSYSSYRSFGSGDRILRGHSGEDFCRHSRDFEPKQFGEVERCAWPKIGWIWLNGSKLVSFNMFQPMGCIPSRFCVTSITFNSKMPWAMPWVICDKQHKKLPRQRYSTGEKNGAVGIS